MSSFRFIHAADIHLDSPLKGLSGTEGSTIERIRSAPRAAFQSLVDLVIEDNMDFLVIAGDLYDGGWRDYSTGLFFAEQMGRLKQANVPVFVLHGNHDAQSQITRPLRLPDNVKVFKPRTAQTILLEEHEVALHGQSYHERAVTSNLVPNYPPPVEDVFNIGVLHTALGGSDLHDNYAPCTLQELVSKGYDYWALGHIHTAEVRNERPPVVFPGNIQGRHIRETGPKGASLVSVENGEVIRIESKALDVVRWSLIHVDATPAQDLTKLLDLIQNALNEYVEEADGRTLVARIVLHGKTDLHYQLAADSEHLTAEVRSIALGLGEEIAWVEKLIVETAPLTDPAVLAKREDSLGDFQRMLKDAKNDEDLTKQVAEHLSTLTSKLPSVLRENCEDSGLRAVLNEDFGTLIESVTPYVIAKLLVEEEE